MNNRVRFIYRRIHYRGKADFVELCDEGFLLQGKSPLDIRLEVPGTEGPKDANAAHKVNHLVHTNEPVSSLAERRAQVC